MSRRTLAWLALFAVGASSCVAAVPRAAEVEISGVVRFVVDEGAIVAASADGFPMLVVKAGQICAGDLDGRGFTGEGIDRIEAAPEAELTVDCVGFVPQVVFPSWSPESTRVAFMGVSEGAESDIWIYDHAGGAVSNVSGDAGEDTLPLWIDEKTVVFVRTNEGATGSGTSWQIVSVDSGVPALLADVDGSVELSAGTTVVVGQDAGRVLFNLTGPDGAIAGIHELDISSGDLRPVYVPTDEAAAEGFSLLDVHPEGALALVVVGSGGLESSASEVWLVDLMAQTERILAPGLGTGIQDVRFSHDGTRILVWEVGTDQGDALVIRSTGSDEDVEVLLHGELGRLDAIGRGATVGIGSDLVLIRIER